MLSSIFTNPFKGGTVMLSSIFTNPFKGGLDQVIASMPCLCAADLSPVISLPSRFSVIDVLVDSRTPEVYEAQQPKANNLKLVVGGAA